LRRFPTRLPALSGERVSAQESSAYLGEGGTTRATGGDDFLNDRSRWRDIIKVHQHNRQVFRAHGQRTESGEKNVAAIRAELRASQGSIMREQQPSVATTCIRNVQVNCGALFA